MSKKCSICGAEVKGDHNYCRYAQRTICTSCCLYRCGYRRGKELSFSVCAYKSLNLNAKHGVYLSSVSQVDRAYEELRTLPTDTVIDTYEYLRAAYRDGISDRDVNFNVRVQLGALQRVIEDRRFTGECEAV